MLVLMKKLLPGAMVFLFLLGLTPPADAHRSGCHRWHSCPSDRTTYMCGDIGYCSQCPDNEYCHNGTYSVGRQQTSDTKPAPSPRATETTAFVGIPRTMAELNSCTVVGNYTSMIYHLKGSRYIPKMMLPQKECFATEADAAKKGFRKAKAQ